MLDIAAYGVYIGILIYAAIRDWRTLRISNKLVITIMLAWLIWQILRDALPRLLPNISEFGLPLVLDTPNVSAAGGVLAAIALGAGLTLFVLAYEAVTRKYSMGGGDIKLMAASALFLGMQRSLIALMIACVAAVLIAPAYSRACKRQRNRFANVSRETFSSSAGEAPNPVSQGSAHAEALHPSTSGSSVSQPKFSHSDFSQPTFLGSESSGSGASRSENLQPESSQPKISRSENSNSAVSHGFPFGPAIAVGSVATLFL